MPLLILLLAMLCALLMAVLLLPVSLLQRYRRGKARRRLQRWVFRLNAVLLPMSAAALGLGAWLWQQWHPLREAATAWHGLGGVGAPTYVAIGWVAGLLVGVVGVLLTRVRQEPGGILFYTPNRWLVLALTLLVAARIVLFIWQAWSGRGDGMLTALARLDHRPLFALAGMLLGYGWAYAIGLLRRTRLPGSLARRPHGPAG